MSDSFEPKRSLEEAVESIPHPVTNDYHECTSADGYAYLAMAKHALGLAHREEVDRVWELDCTLQSTNYIDGIEVPAGTWYTYTAWVCAEMFDRLGDEDGVEEMRVRTRRIGVRTDKMVQYCDAEIHQTIPNATSAAAATYALAKAYTLAGWCAEVLRVYQEDGNWWYKDFRDVRGLGKAAYKQEDPMHLALMLRQLRSIKPYTDIRVDDMFKPIIDRLYEMNEAEMYRGYAGWGPAALCAALSGIDTMLGIKAQRAAREILEDETQNFRARAMSAWALSVTP